MMISNYRRNLLNHNGRAVMESGDSKGDNLTNTYIGKVRAK